MTSRVTSPENLFSGRLLIFVGEAERERGGCTRGGTCGPPWSRRFPDGPASEGNAWLPARSRVHAKKTSLDLTPSPCTTPSFTKGSPSRGSPSDGSGCKQGKEWGS